MRIVHSSSLQRDARARWLRLHYSQTYLEQPRRGLLRFLCRSSEPVEHVLPAAVFGRARWLGIVPDDAVGFELSFDLDSDRSLRVERVERLKSFAIAMAILRNRPLLLPGFLLSLRSSDTRTQMLRALSALDFAPLTEVRAFAEPRRRAVEPTALDADPDIDAAASTIEFVIVDEPGSPGDALSRTLGSLAKQSDRGFSARLLHDDVFETPEDAARVVPLQLARRSRHGPLSVAECLGSTEADWIAELKPGDVLAPEAVLCLRALLRRTPDLDAVYTDSLVRGPDDRRAYGQAKPDWSPTFFRQRDYIGRLLLLRTATLRRLPAEQTIGRSNTPAAVLAAPHEPPLRIEHLRRFLIKTAERPPADPAPAAPANESSHTVSGRSRPSETPPSFPPGEGGREADGRGSAPVSGVPAHSTVLCTVPLAQRARSEVTTAGFMPKQHQVRASIVIPTRDRLDLLRTAIDSLDAHTPADAMQIVIVDNDSQDAACLDYLTAIESRPNVIVVRHPGAFNFSAMINRGAASSSGEVLILLNNDCAALHDGWLPALTDLATQPDVGAVGAKLLYDDGTLQHAGVGIGLGGEAGHRNRRRSADHAGHLDRLRYTHEVSAVTGACLAVERRKFDAVGGFDEAFAVAFNDIDFCLRLSARGLRTLYTPHATLRHSESVSRGSDQHPSRRARWEAEAKLFRERWLPAILDDLYMHPSFCLWRFDEMLH